MSCFNITAYGAVADGKTDSTQAFQAAIAAAVQTGGGAIYVPSGVFVCGPIHLQSNMTLYLEAGAVLKFATDHEKHPVIPYFFQGVETELFAPLIYAVDAENITIAGRGVLDGQGQYWWSRFPGDFQRPRFICPIRCQNVLIDGVKIINSPCWTINPILCENVTVNQVTIVNPADSPNTDGIDPESCKNVHISNCHIDVGDDCIAIKSGVEKAKYRVACENITITNCTMVHGHGGVVIGSEMSGGVRNVVITNCVFEGTDRGIRIKSRRGRGGIVEDLRVSNIIMKGVMTPFVMNMYYHCGEGGKEPEVWDKNPHPVNEKTPVFRRIHFSDITVREATAAAGFLYGLPEQPVEEISFQNVSVHLAEGAEPGLPAMMCHLEPMKNQGFYCNNVKNLAFRQVKVSGHEGPAFTLENVEGLVLTGCQAEPVTPGAPLYKLSGVKGAQLEQVNGS